MTDDLHKRNRTQPSLLAVVEEVWAEEANGGFCLSSGDIQLARRWQASRVPVRVIERALRTAFANWSQQDSPRSLQFADRHVSAAIERHINTHADSGPTVEPTLPDRSLLKETLTELGRSASEQRTVESLRAGYRVLLSVEGQAHTVWEVVRETVFSALESRLRPDEQARLARLLRECNDKRMSEGARKRQRMATRERFFADEFELNPLLTLPSTLQW